MIKAIIFDFGTVLITEDWSVIDKKIVKELKIDERKVEATLKPFFKRMFKGKLNEKDFWKKIEKKTRTKISKKFSNNFWFKMHKDWSKDVKGSWKILGDLHKKKIRLIILSNIIKPTFLANKAMGRIKKLKAIGVEAFIWSYKEGFSKPDIRLYKIALKKLNLPPENCVFIDDKLKNIKAAKKLGIKGILFKSPRQLKQELIKLGLL